MGLREVVGALFLREPDDDHDFFRRRDESLSRFDEPLHQHFNPPYDQEEEEWGVGRP